MQAINCGNVENATPCSEQARGCKGYITHLGLKLKVEQKLAGKPANKWDGMNHVLKNSDEFGGFRKDSWMTIEKEKKGGVHRYWRADMWVIGTLSSGVIFA